MVFPKTPLASKHVLEAILDEIDEIHNVATVVKIELTKIEDKQGNIEDETKAPESSFTIREICGKGTGMFASKKLYPGGVILAEKPLIILPDEVFSDFKRTDAFLDKAVNKMSSEERRSFLELHDSRGLDMSYAGTFYTNTMTYDVVNAAIMPIMARVNHSCKPNAEFITRKDLGVQHLVAMHVISPEEEICINYMAASAEGTDDKETRQKYLGCYYGFQCICGDCSLQGDELNENEEAREEVKEFQAVGLANLPVEDLELLLEKCHVLGCKLSYILEIIHELHRRAEEGRDDLVNKVKFGVKGCIIANIVYGEGSVQSDHWKQKAHFWNNNGHSALY